MSTSEYDRWQTLTVRRPDDVRTAAGGPVPLIWQMERRQQHADRLGNNALPADWEYPVERGGADDAVAVLALSESIRRDIETFRPIRVREALQLGATWAEAAAALGVAPQAARDLLHAWADSQHRLHRTDMERGQARPLGITAEQHAALLALIALGDDQRPTDRPQTQAAR